MAKQICFGGFIPCRDERCKDRIEVHPEHDIPSPKARVDTCPNCNGDVFPLPRRRAACVVCSWRGSRFVKKNVNVKKETHSHA